MGNIKLTFDPELPFQKKAWESVVDLFKGQDKDSSEYFYETSDLMRTVANKLTLSEGAILANLQKVQERNKLQVSKSLEGMHFSIEMETGTGKTYVYLRTIYELNKEYGFKKFIIVVPSLAIKAGVNKNLNLIKEDEFIKNLYNNVQFRPSVYDSRKIELKAFAKNDNIEVLVINIDSFAKDRNIITRVDESGREPIDYIKQTSPIVIIDEPQNMETANRRDAISNLNPLCTLRYSATHTKTYNLLYSLDPVEAYELGLVKQIEVDSVFEINSSSGAFVELVGFNTKKTMFGKIVTAKLRIDLETDSGVIRDVVEVGPGDDLYDLSKKRVVYENGYKVQSINREDGYVTFSEAPTVRLGERRGGLTDDIMKLQIRRTIDEHFSKELKYKRLGLGIKVLSLFFIDRVSNYRTYGEHGEPLAEGKFALWFREIYNDLKKKNTSYASLPEYSEAIHKGYFSKDSKQKPKDTSGETSEDEDTYKIIMEEKEKLLDFDNKIRFIFSHSALREGWDNPNVFQICTLNETKSEMKKRQEIGRGLRLPVNQKGERCWDKNINILTVVANESYKDFANALQRELKSDGLKYVDGMLKRKQDRVTVGYKKGFKLDPAFREIWERIRAKTTYRADYDTDKLKDDAIELMKSIKITPPRVFSTKVALKLSEEGVTTTDSGSSDTLPGEFYEERSDYIVPDILSYITGKTKLTRVTTYKILKDSGKLDLLPLNPQMFMELATEAIERALQKLMIKGIKYIKINNSVYEMNLFEDYDAYFNANTVDFSEGEEKLPNKTVYSRYMPLDSDTEKEFALNCERDPHVRLYFKLPGWFKIPTPIGNYNPDWAIVLEGDKKVYFVAETKSTGEADPKNSAVNRERGLRPDEDLKITCGTAHFKKVKEEFKDVDYALVRRVGDLLDPRNILTTEEGSVSG